MATRRYAVCLMLIVFFIIFLLTGCGGGGGSDLVVSSPASSPSPAVQTNKADSSDKSRILTPQATVSATQSLVTASNTMGISLLNQISEGNAVVAPFSVFLSLAQLRAGAAGDTKSGISQTMNLDATTDWDAAFNSLDLAIGGRIALTTLGDQTSLSSSKGWAQKGYGYLLTFLDNMVQNYGLPMTGVDYALAYSDASATITSWASAASGGVSGAVNVSKDTRLVLGDALRLNAAWGSPFDASQTATGWFQLTNGKYEEVPFMRQQAVISSTSGDGYAAYELPVGGQGLTFLIIVPDQGKYNTVVSSLTAAKIGQIAGAMTPSSIDLRLPKFTITNSSISLSVGNGTQKDVADFSTLDGTKDLYVTSNTQSTKLAITETGIQGSSITLLGLDDAHPETWTNPSDNGYGYIDSVGLINTLVSNHFLPSVPVVIGRPFVFVVRDSVSGAILFMGRLIDPSNGQGEQYSVAYSGGYSGSSSGVSISSGTAIFDDKTISVDSVSITN